MKENTIEVNKEYEAQSKLTLEDQNHFFAKKDKVIVLFTTKDLVGVTHQVSSLNTKQAYLLTRKEFMSHFEPV